ncbi:MAG: hypothetical protein IE886_06835 [Campylobacterales bacterium]|nr:hypothetical protein [Campylobacterales bacterium]
MIEAKLAAASAGIVTLAMFEHRLFARATALGLDLRGAIIVDPDDKQQKLHLAKAYTSSAPTRGSASKLPMTLWAIQPSSRR